MNNLAEKNSFDTCSIQSKGMRMESVPFYQHMFSFLKTREKGAGIQILPPLGYQPLEAVFKHQFKPI